MYKSIISKLCEVGVDSSCISTFISRKSTHRNIVVGHAWVFFAFEYGAELEQNMCKEVKITLLFG